MSKGINPYTGDVYNLPESVPAGSEAATISTPDDGEVHLTPKAASVTGARGVMYFNSADDHVYVGAEV